MKNLACSSHIIKPSKEAQPLPPSASLPLLAVWSGLALVRLNWVQHDLVCELWVVVRVSLAPVVRHGVREDVAAAVEARSGDGTADFGVAFQTVLGVFVPEVECAVAA